MRTAAQTAMLMAILTLISKGFGFVREMFMANYFGTSYVTDAYVMALAIPGIIFAGVLGSVATAYMPIYSRIAEKQGEAESNKFTSQVLNILLLVSIVAAIVGIIFSDQIVAVFASGFSGETAALCSFFLKVTFSYMIFTSTAGVLEAFLQYKGVFLQQIIAGYVMNIALISVIVLSGLFSKYYLAFGWLLAYIIRFIIIGILAKNRKFKYTMTLSKDKNVTNIVTLAVPVFIGSTIGQINVFVDKTMASGLPEGSVAALNYGMLLIGLVTGLTISILMTILYPKLAQANSQLDNERFSDIIGTGMTLIAIVAIPCSLGAMVYSNQIVQIVYERGAFDPVATAFTATAFFYYAIGLLFLSVNDLMIRAYYSMHDMRTPLMFGGFSVAINIILILILVGPMGLAGLALATSIAALCNTILLFAGIRWKHPGVNVLKSKTKLAKIAMAAVFAVGASALAYQFIIMPLSYIIVARIAQLTIAVIVAGVVYFLLLYVMKIEELKMIKQIIKR
jgi:putative peptidoglycan lipid II flippase